MYLKGKIIMDELSLCCGGIVIFMIIGSCFEYLGPIGGCIALVIGAFIFISFVEGGGLKF